jgi:hypothetical protein
VWYKASATLLLSATVRNYVKRTKETSLSQRKAIITLLSLFLFAFSTSLRASPPIAAVIQTSHYNPQTNIITLRVNNTGSKDITAINFAISATYPTGNGGAASFGYSFDFVDGIIASIEHGYEIAPGARHGIAPGEFRDLDVPVSPPIASFRATVDMVIYADGAADVQNRMAFNRIMLQRKGEMLALEKANQLLAAALADPNIEHPSATVAAQLKALAHASATNKDMNDPASYEEGSLLNAAQNIGNSPKERVAEEDHLHTLIKTHESQMTLLSSHIQGVRQ